MDPVLVPGLLILAASTVWLVVGMVFVARQRKQTTVPDSSRSVAVFIFAVATIGFAVAAVFLLSA